MTLRRGHGLSGYKAFFNIRLKKLKGRNLNSAIQHLPPTGYAADCSPLPCRTRESDQLRRGLGKTRLLRNIRFSPTASSPGQRTKNQPPPRAHAQSGGRPRREAPGSGAGSHWLPCGPRKLRQPGGAAASSAVLLFSAVYKQSGAGLCTSSLGGASQPKAPTLNGFSGVL